MPFPFGMGSKPRLQISVHTTVGLTETGKRLAEQYEPKGATFVIVSTLQERQPQSVGEIAREANMDVDEVKERIKLLARQGYIRVMSTEI